MPGGPGFRLSADRCNEPTRHRARVFSEANYWQLTDWMTQRFLENGIHIACVYHCPYHPQFGQGSYKLESRDRKPNPGMLLCAKSDFDLDLASSFLVGDKLSDFEAARTAGVGAAILLQSRYLPPLACASYPIYESLDGIRLTFFSSNDASDAGCAPASTL
jgi:hypothetical protein